MGACGLKELEALLEMVSSDLRFTRSQVSYNTIVHPRSTLMDALVHYEIF